ncbi:MAG TPA: toll/interleukin-1 receptor domain-containing protein [Mycobacteriales bacterium]|nr:toll/interleukin-1 receptor domain-containing protein [Mycobacteriales bacterium]
MDGDGYDVFLSYAWEDARAAGEITESLRRGGVRVFRDVSGMRDYDDIGTHISAALSHSRCLVALYTPDFPVSPYCRWELYTALTSAYHLDRHTGRVLALVRDLEYENVRPAQLTGLRLPDRSAPVEDVTRSIVAKLGQIDGRVFGDAPAQPKPEWYPYPPAGDRHFYGRLAELWDIHDALFANEDASAPGPAVARVVGLGGQGKTMLAERYAATFADDHPGGVFVLRGFGSHRHTVGDPVRIAALRDDQVADVAARLGLAVDRRPPASVDGALRDHLTRTGLPYLWIVDDLPGGIDTATCRSLFVPTALGRTLVTTRHDAGYRWGAEIRLGELDPGAALALLTSRRATRGRRDLAAARAVTDDLGRHALGLAVAAGLAAQPDFTGYPALREAIGQTGPDVLEVRDALRRDLPDDHAAGIAATLLRSISKLTDAGREVLRVASLLAPAPVPEDLLASVLAGAHGDRADVDARAGLREAAGRSLARADLTVETPLWSVHALVSRTVRVSDIDHGRRDRLRAAAIVTLTNLLERSRTDPARRELADYLPHARGVAGELAGEPEWHLVNEAARAHVEFGDERTALQMYSTLYAACRASLGPDDPTTLAVRSGLAVAHGLLGDHETALNLKMSVHEGLRDRLGPDHPDTLTALNNVAITYGDLGDHHRAREIFTDVYRIRRRLWQVQHPQTLAALGNLAVAVGRGGDHRLARRLKRAVVARSVATHGPDHPFTLDAMNNLAASELVLGDASVARDLFAEVHRRRSRRLGHTHPDTLSALENSVIADRDDGRIRDTLDGVYRARLSAQGPDHPDTRRTLRSLLTAHRRLGAGITGGPSTLDEESDTDALPSYPPPPIDGLPDGPRLDDPTTDERIELFLLADEVHRTGVRAKGDGHPETLLLRGFLAHATALLNQMDQQFTDAQVLARDAFEGLVEELGAYHADTMLVSRLLDWIDELADSDD